MKEMPKLIRSHLMKNPSSASYLLVNKSGDDSSDFFLKIGKEIVKVREGVDDVSDFYPDIHLYGEDKPITIDEVREIIEKASTKGYSGGTSIFIIKNLHLLRKESINALLKVIEEPLNGVFFLLTSSTNKILQTIISRCIVVDLPRRMPSDFNISNNEYDFFLGKGRDIERYLEVKDEVDLEKPLDYKSVEESIKKYGEDRDILSKIEIYKCIRDFLNTKDLLKSVDRIWFGEKLGGLGKDREFIKDVVEGVLTWNKDMDFYEKGLKIKDYFNYNVDPVFTFVKLFLSL